MTANINGHDYELVKTIPFTFTDSELMLNVITESIDDLLDVIGASPTTTIIVQDDRVWTDLAFDRLLKIWSDETFCEVVFRFKNLEKAVDTHTDDIEAISQAIMELADIIGGGE